MSNTTPHHTTPHHTTPHHTTPHHTDWVLTNLIRQRLNLILFSFFLFIYPILAPFDAVSQSNINLCSFGSNTIHVGYIPFEGDVNSVQYRTSTFIIDYEGSNWTVERKAAMNFAAHNIMSNIVTSGVDIRIRVKWDNLGNPFNDSYLAKVIIPSYYGASIVLPQSGTNEAYCPALANKLVGYDLDPAEVDFEIIFNSFYIDGIDQFNYSTSGVPVFGGNQWDFVTLCLKEMGKGLGLHSSVTANSYGTEDGHPLIYDNFIHQKLPNGSYQALKNLSTNTPDPIITAMGTSYEMYWLSGSNANETPLGVFTYFMPGTTLSTINIPLEVNYLFLEKGWANHNPGAPMRNMLADIGWSVDYTWTGIEDELLLHGFNYTNFTSQGGVSDHYENPITTIEAGSTYYYAYEFIDEEPLNPLNTSTQNWKLELSHSEGVVVIAQGNGFSASGLPIWALQVPQIPSGYIWNRHPNGTIKAKVILTVNDISGQANEAKLNIGIKYAPDQPLVEIANTSWASCSSVNISFIAFGAQNYTVSYRDVNSSNWNTVVVPEHQNNFLLSGLIETAKYEIVVTGINEYGETNSLPIIRENCKFTFVSYPNPAISDVRIEKEGDIPILEAKITKVNDPNITTTKVGDGISNEMEMNINAMPGGSYQLKVKDTEGKESSKTILKF